MKKIYPFIAFAFVVSYSHAQSVSMDFIPFHYSGYDITQFQNKILQQRDGDLVANVIIANGGGQVPPTIIGNIFYKISPTTLQFTDSLLVPNATPAWYLFAQDPRSVNNLRVNIEPDGNGGTALRISHFSDDDLNANHAEDVVVPLYDSIAFDFVDNYMIDSQGDLIVKFYTERPNGSYVCHIARFGLDGTLKHATELPESQNFLVTMDEFESAPKQYYQWKKGSNENLFIYVIDSMFQIKNNYMINHVLRDTLFNGSMNVYEQFRFNNDNSNSTFVIPDGEDVLIAAPYIRDSGWVYEFQESGAAVARYEMRTMQRKALAHFNDWPGPSTYVNIMCLQKTSDGNLYLVYRETDLEYTPYMVAVKMGRDLNVIWRRYCYEPQSLKFDFGWSEYSNILKDENGNEKGIYIAGYSYYPQVVLEGIFFFFLTDDDITATEECCMQVRPYMYYPNPAQDQLHLQYSPDVLPKQIELYDLQGRQVHTQSQGLESVDLHGLAPGQYLMKVTLEDGKSYTDKAVKE